MTHEERFERIEASLVTSNDRMDRMENMMQQIVSGHQELEAAQLNTSKSLDRFINETRSRFDEVGEKIGDLTILVDRLIARDLGA